MRAFWFTLYGTRGKREQRINIMAAHSIPDHLRRKIILSVRVTESEAERLREEADSKGVTVPDYLRSRMLESAK